MVCPPFVGGATFVGGRWPQYGFSVSFTSTAMPSIRGPGLLGVSRTR